MIVRTPRDDLVAPFHQTGAHRARIRKNLLLVYGELRLQSFEKRDRFRGNHVHQRSALRPGEYQRAEFPGDLRILARENEAATRSAQGLVGRGGHDVGVRNGVRIQTRRHESGNMRHVDHEIGTDASGDDGEPCPIDDARVSREPGDDHFRAVLFGQTLHLLVVDLAGVRTDAVLRRTEELP